MSLSEHDLAKTERLYAHHRNLNTVARILGITGPAVSYRLKKAGVAFDARPRPTSEEDAGKRRRNAVWSPADIYSPEA